MPPHPFRFQSVARLLPLGWLVLLFAPALTVYSSVDAWDFAPYSVTCISAWLILGARLVLPARAFYWGTWPLQWFGVVAMAATFFRNVDLLELTLVVRTFDRQQIQSALGPYLLAAIASAAALAWLAHLCVRGDSGVPALKRAHAAALSLLVGCALAVWVPSPLWLRAWPLNAAAVVIVTSAGSSRIDNLLFPNTALSNPRAEHGSWKATRAEALAGPETYVLVIGESVRADALRECGASSAMPRLAAGALVACDVTSGSDATHTSVPLLISREMPGLTRRVPVDATFQKAFEEVGFHTYWIGMHDETLSWTDAQEQVYVGSSGRNEAMVGPRLDGILADGSAHRAIVVHSFDAHLAYCLRFDRKRKNPFRDTCDELGDLPTLANLEAWKSAYGNAVADTVDFLSLVIARLERLPGPVFMIYSPDHGEALLDDRRQIHGHARREPTRWDVHVPAVFWANAAWREQHPDAWRNLNANYKAPLMHVDLVPTLLGAAGIRYQDNRSAAIDLTANTVPAGRERRIQSSLGHTVSWEQLVKDAR